MSSSNCLPYPRFLKVVLQEAIDNKTLMLPRRFLWVFKEELAGSEAITMEVPDGRIWTVGLNRSERENGNEVWLKSGFEHFLRFYSISPKFFLIFKHLESSRFKVVICGHNACEIAYPAAVSRNNRRQSSPELVSEQEEEDSGGHNQSSPDVVSEQEEEDSDGHNHNALWMRLTETKNIVLSNKFNATSFSMLSPMSERAMERVVEINPRNISTVVVLMRYHIVKGLMAFPARFVKEFCSGNSRVTKLRVNDEMADEWAVEVVKNKNGQWFMRGWCRFCKDKDLTQGDVCLFELIRAEADFLRVHIFRAAD